MSIDGKKVKLHIGQIKEAIDDNTSESLLKCFRLLLIAEISQRGIIVPLDSSDDKLLQAIISTAGKTLLDENQVKSPLIAGAAVVSAMVAQKCSDIAFANESHITILNKETWTGAFQRCQDVNDNRLLSLLKIATESAIAKESLSIGNMEGVALLLQRIAFGNNLRASSFSKPDQPPMFKRSLDSCLKNQNTLRCLLDKVDDKKNDGQIQIADIFKDDHEAYYSQDLILPLENLIRIAESKNNVKRVAELSMRLAQSYIGSEGDSSVSEVLAECGYQLWKDINVSAVDAYNTKPSKGASSIELVMKAKGLLDTVDVSTFDNASDVTLITLFKLLQVRVEFELEDTLVKAIGDQRHVAARNRSGLSAGKVTRNELEGQVRRQLVTGTLPAEEAEGETMDYDKCTLDIVAVALCEQFLSFSADEMSQISQCLLDEMCVGIERQIDRLVLRAQSVALALVKKKNRDAVFEAWDSVLGFIDPLVNSVAERGNSLTASQIKTMSKAHQSVLVSAMEAVLVYSWMTAEQSTVRTTLVRTSTKFLTAMLKLLKEREEEEKKHREAIEGKVVSTSRSSKSRLQLRLEVSCRAARCHLLLSSIGSEKDVTAQDANQIQRITEESIKLAGSQLRSKLLPHLNAKFGVPFLQFLATWAGLHGSPWSYYNISQARTVIRYVRSGIKDALKIWGRKLSHLEEIVSDIGEADSECGVLSGGMSIIAGKLYITSLEKLSKGQSDPMQSLLRAHCIASLTRLQLVGPIDNTEDKKLQKCEDETKASMTKLSDLLKPIGSTPYFYVWREECSLSSSIAYHISMKRQLIAELLLHSSRQDEAQSFLEDAIKASPQNYEVAFAYGAFLLQMALYDGGGSDSGLSKLAQVQLLKSAKLNTTKAGPFALLGIWYELRGDNKRSVGCFSKALLMDPTHPVAGRGMLRAKSTSDASTLLNNALDMGIFQNGWAWKASGDSNALVEGDDERAVICYQQALRARDIGNPKQHRLNIFFALPKDITSGVNECGNTWASLGGCYRRLGKHSASVRAFQAAHDINPDDLSFFCSWAQVELELGLLDEAAEKFEKVLDNENLLTRYNAAYGLGLCMLVFARMATGAGKHGDALSYVKRGINALLVLTNETTDINFNCAWKLVGDLYSFCFVIPFSVFAQQGTLGEKEKYEFISEGENAYTRIIENIANETDENKLVELLSIRTTALVDNAINFLLRARIQSEILHDGSGIERLTSMDDIAKNEEMQVLLTSSVRYFLEAIELDPFSPISWSGVGCALVFRDPMLAQHAFSRALQLDKGTEDAWANMSLLYFDRDQAAKSEETVDSLTQVADSAIMWIARGLLIEKQSQKSSENTDTIISRAADAYRASLQISHHQGGLLGLSLTSRRLGVNNSGINNEYEREAEKVGSKESYANLEMFLHSGAKRNLGALALYGIMTFEKGLSLHDQENCCQDHAKQLLAYGKEMLAETQTKIDKLPLPRPLPIEEGQSTVIRNSSLELKKTFKSFGMKDMKGSLETCSDAVEKIFHSDQCDRGTDSSESRTINNARRDVIIDPGNALLWLAFSKALLSALTPDSSKASYQAVRAAINKTKEIMVSNTTEAPLLHPPSKGFVNVHRSISAAPISSEKLSEAFALSHWVQDITVDEKKEDSFDLQRSLMLDPMNLMARHGLESLSC